MRDVKVAVVRKKRGLLTGLYEDLHDDRYYCT